jgi:hypothetical protein
MIIIAKILKTKSVYNTHTFQNLLLHVQGTKFGKTMDLRGYYITENDNNLHSVWPQSFVEAIP